MAPRDPRPWMLPDDEEGRARIDAELLERRGPTYGLRNSPYFNPDGRSGFPGAMRDLSALTPPPAPALRAAAQAAPTPNVPVPPNAIVPGMEPEAPAGVEQASPAQAAARAAAAMSGGARGYGAIRAPAATWERERAPSVNPQGLDDPDWALRPEGEAELEDFYFDQMIRMGRNTPQMYAQGFRDIQARKQARITARADYNASLIKEQFANDLVLSREREGRNASAAENAVGRLFQAQLQAQELTARSREAALDREAQAGLIEAEQAAAEKKALKEDRDMFFKADKEFRPRFEKLAKNITTVDEIAGILGDEVWTGFYNTPGRLMSSVLQSPEQARLKKLIAEMALDRAGAIVDSSITKEDRKRIDDTLANFNTPMGAWFAALKEASNAYGRSLTQEFDSLGVVSPELRRQMEVNFGDIRKTALARAIEMEERVRAEQGQVSAEERARIPAWQIQSAAQNARRQQYLREMGYIE